MRHRIGEATVIGHNQRHIVQQRRHAVGVLDKVGPGRGLAITPIPRVGIRHHGCCRIKLHGHPIAVGRHHKPRKGGHRLHAHGDIL